MPKFEEVFEQHKDDLGSIEGIGEQFPTITNKLSELGYDVIINDKKKAEFVPSSRLSEVVGQRDQFKTQVETLNSELQKMKEKAEGQGEKKQIQELINKNNSLLEKLEQASVDLEVISEASDAIDPRDILPFIDKSKLAVGEDGKVSGVKEEIARIRKEKPHLFGKKKGGNDRNNDSNSVTGGMNTLIRRAAGRG